MAARAEPAPHEFSRACADAGCRLCASIAEELDDLGPLGDDSEEDV